MIRTDYAHRAGKRFPRRRAPFNLGRFLVALYLAAVPMLTISVWAAGIALRAAARVHG